VEVLALTGEHDLYTASDLQTQLQAVLTETPAVVVDLTETTFIDSSIVGVLIDARQTAEQSSKGFSVCLAEDSAPTVRRIFEITGLTAALPVLPDRDQASQAAAAGAKTAS